jgi:hypothetical protein
MVYIYEAMYIEQYMRSSVFFKVCYEEKSKKWSADEKDMYETNVTQYIECSIWSICSIALLLIIATLFSNSTWMLDIDTAITMTCLYTLTCLLLSNEYMYSDWHTEYE